MKIYKYRLHGIGPLPQGFQVLHIGLQRGEPTVWCAVDPEAPPVTIGGGLLVLPTGAEIPEGVEHVGSFLMMQDNLVWHVFRNKV